jgi:hypothetical protein
MSLLTEKERKFLEFALKNKKTSYQTARHFGEDPGYVSRTFDSAIKKLQEAEETLAWAKILGYPQNLLKNGATSQKKETIVKAAY